MLVRKKFLRPFFICPEKIWLREINFHPPPRSPTLFGEKKNSSKGLLKKKNNEHSKKFWKKIRARWKWTTPPITFLMVRPLRPYGNQAFKLFSTSTVSKRNVRFALPWTSI